MRGRKPGPAEHCEARHRRPDGESGISASSQFRLPTERRVLRDFLAQFAGALDDNVFRNGVAFLLAWQLALPRELMVAKLALALFLLPSFPFSALAGHRADRLEPAALIRAIKRAEIPIMALAALGFRSAPSHSCSR